MRGGSKAIWNFSKNSANLVAGPFPNHFFVLKTSKNAMKHMILSFKMKGDVISDHFLMLWFPYVQSPNVWSIQNTPKE